MPEISAAPMRAFNVRVAFFSGGDRFAADSFRINVSEGEDPMAVAHTAADASVYCDDRVPDLNRTIDIEPVDPDDPDPPPAAGGAMKPVCPRCGSDDIVRDATARWDVDSGCWSLSGTFDNETCDTCGAEGDDFAHWIPAEPLSPRDTFLWDVSRALQNASLVQDADFQLFCLNGFDRVTVEQAAADWRAR
jgi:predicted RNA-binding Zn-ribbon protein involved in translation (DUF1610 family)